MTQPPPLPQWIQAMLPAGIERSMLEVEGRCVHVMQLGPPDGLPVLMLHGNPTWGFLYRRVAQALADTPLRLILPDLIGLGFSDKPTDAALHTLANHGRWLGQLIEQLGLRRLIFVGQDWGGPIGLRGLADTPERLAGLVILNTVVGPPKPGFKATAFHRFSRLPLISEATFKLAGFPQIGLHFAQGDKTSIRGAVARAYRYPLRRIADRAAPLALARMVPDTMQHPSIPELQRCQDLVEAYEGPTAMVWGDRNPVLGRLRRRIERLIPNADITVTQAGHFLQEEVPDEIAKAIQGVAGL